MLDSLIRVAKTTLITYNSVKKLFTEFHNETNSSHNCIAHDQANSIGETP
jgi:hypothetical protein